MPKSTPQFKHTEYSLGWTIDPVKLTPTGLGQYLLLLRMQGQSERGKKEIVLTDA